ARVHSLRFVVVSAREVRVGSGAAGEGVVDSTFGVGSRVLCVGRHSGSHGSAISGIGVRGDAGGFADVLRGFARERISRASCDVARDVFVRGIGGAGGIVCFARIPFEPGWFAGGTGRWIVGRGGSADDAVVRA